MVERKFDLYSVQADTVNAAYGRGLRAVTIAEDSSPWLTAGLVLVEKKGGEVTKDDMEAIDQAEKELSSPDPWFQGFSLFKLGR